jgi:hypothetical protein
MGSFTSIGVKLFVKGSDLMGWLFLEAEDIEGIKFRIFIAVGFYLFMMLFAIFYSLYKISMISHNKRFKNIFLFLMSVFFAYRSRKLNY